MNKAVKTPFIQIGFCFIMARKYLAGLILRRQKQPSSVC